MSTHWISTNPEAVVHPIELVPGSYNRDAVREASIYLPEEQFAHFEALLVLHDPLSSFSRYAFTEVPLAIWAPVIEDMHAWVTQIDDNARLDQITPSPGFISAHSRQRFLERETENLRAFRETSDQLATWLKDAAHKHGVVSVLGM
ncbi:MAG: hypothetical protein GVY25_16040 [Bacteroidetes bacterium]|jgi:hypothetical protein|nr:hypothetical protein [Bacteroidota bacterium]